MLVFPFYSICISFTLLLNDYWEITFRRGVFSWVMVAGIYAFSSVFQYFCMYFSITFDTHWQNSFRRGRSWEGDSRHLCLYFHLYLTYFFCISSYTYWQSSFRRGGSGEFGSSIGQGQPRRVYSELPSILTFVFFLVFVFTIVFVFVSIFSYLSWGVCIWNYLVLFLNFVFAIVFLSVFILASLCIFRISVLGRVFVCC